MDYQKFYKQLFQPVEERIGPIDTETLMAIIGFDCGGPLSFCTVGRQQEKFVTYVSCELAVREGQKVGDTGPFEVMMTCDDEAWARNILTKIGQMSFDAVFEHGHTVDIGEIVGAECPMQEFVVEEFARVTIDQRDYGILNVHGVTRSELEFAMKFGSDKLLERLEQAGIYPNTSIHRRE